MTLSPIPPSPNPPRGARRDLGGVDHRTDARRHAAADVAALVERRVVANLGDGDFGSTIKFEKVEQPM